MWILPTPSYQLTWTCLVPTKCLHSLFGFLTFDWFQVICGISNFPILLLSPFSRAQTAKDDNLSCRKSWPFMLWPWFLLVSESWQIKSLNFLRKFPEVSKKLSGSQDWKLWRNLPGGWLLWNRAEGAPSTTLLFSKYPEMWNYFFSYNSSVCNTHL